EGWWGEDGPAAPRALALRSVRLADDFDMEAVPGAVVRWTTARVEMPNLDVGVVDRTQLLDTDLAVRAAARTDITVGGDISAVPDVGREADDVEARTDPARSGRVPTDHGGPARVGAHHCGLHRLTTDLGRVGRARRTVRALCLEDR